MRRVTPTRNLNYAIGLLLLLSAVTVHSFPYYPEAKEGIIPTSSDDRVLKSSIDNRIDNDNEHIDNNLDDIDSIDPEKRDVIKGPSFIPNIDVNTADSELAYENDEVSEEGSRRLNIGTPYLPDAAKKDENINPKDRIENNLDNIENIASNDNDVSWDQHMRGISRLIQRNRLLHNAGSGDQRASKKDSVAERHYDEDDSTKGYSKSDVVSNDREGYSDDIVKPTETASELQSDRFDYKSTKSETSKMSENENEVASAKSEATKPFVTEDGFSMDERVVAEPVIPAHTMVDVLGSKLPPIAKRRRPKINLVLNVQIDEKPARRSKVGSGNFEGMPTLTESALKRHLYFHNHHIRGLRSRHHKYLQSRSYKNSLKSEAASGEGSGSGFGETKPKHSESYYQSNTATKSIPQNTIAADTYMAQANAQAPEQAMNFHGEQDSEGQESKEEPKTENIEDNKEEIKESRGKDNKEIKETYDRYHSTKSEEEDNEASGSGSVSHNKETSTQESGSKPKVTLGYAENKQKAKSPTKENENKYLEKGSENKEAEKEETVSTLENKEAENEKGTPTSEKKEAEREENNAPAEETKDPEKEDNSASAESKEGEKVEASQKSETSDVEKEDSYPAANNRESNEQHKANNAEQSDSEDSNKEQETSEAHKEVTDGEGKAKALESHLSQNADENEAEEKPDENASNKSDDGSEDKKEKSGEVVGNNVNNDDGTDNMKKKNGQEDKYETLEEVREKFKKWQSKINTNPSEQPTSDSNDSSAEKTEDSENTEESTPVKSPESATAKSGETSQAKSVQIAPVKAEETAPVKSEESEPVKTAESANVKPEETVPLKAEESSAVKFVKSAHVKPEESVPVKPEDSAPLKSTESVPVKPEETMPVKPEETMPVKPEETMPVKAADTAPVKAVEVAAVKPVSNNPVKVEESVQAKAGEINTTMQETVTSGESTPPLKSNAGNTPDGKLVYAQAGEIKPVDSIKEKETNLGHEKTSNDVNSNKQPAEYIAGEKESDESPHEKKTTDIASSKQEYVTGEKEAEEKEEGQELKESQPTNDLVKELIGISPKTNKKHHHTEQSSISVNEKANVEATAKPNEVDTKENESQDMNLISPFDKLKGASDAKSWKEEEKNLLAKLKSPYTGEDKFNMDEVNKNNKEHHDIADSDMKETPEKVNINNSEDMSKVNGSNVPGVVDQQSAEEKPITETSTSTSEMSASAEQDMPKEDKTLSQTPSGGEKAISHASTIDEKTTSIAPTVDEKISSQASHAEDKRPSQETYAEGKTPLQASHAEEKASSDASAVDKNAQHISTEVNAVKPISHVTDKSLKQGAKVFEKQAKKTKEAESVERPVTEAEVEKPATSTASAMPQEKHVNQLSTAEEKPIQQTKESNDISQSQEKTTSSKKATAEEPTESSEFSMDQEKPLSNPLIAKEANEFSNEQEKSFASAIERIKAQEEKLKGKEISNEIHEIQEMKFNKDGDVNKEETINKDIDEEPAATENPTVKKHAHMEPKKPSEKNLKQLKLYKHQILSEVEKIDDLMSEYQKDGHSTKELSEAKEVLENDLKLVRELEKNTKKKSPKKEREKGQVMPSLAYLSNVNDEKEKAEMPHREKSSLDAKSLSKSLEREAERNEKQLANLIPSYEYYFHSDSKTNVKHPKKQSLEEIHKLLKAEIKRLKQKKNGKADGQLKNIRKLVQQHLKKLISTGDIDKSAFHSLAPEIKQLGELLKERIKSLKKKKIARKNKVKKFKEDVFTQNVKPGNKKPNDLYDQSIEAQVATNEVKGGRVKGGRRVHHHLVEPRIKNALEPSSYPTLDKVRGEEEGKGSSITMLEPANRDASPTTDPAEARLDTAKLGLNETMLLSVMSEQKGGDPTQRINIKNLLKTLNEKLGAVYQKAKDVHQVSFKADKTSQKTSEALDHQAEESATQNHRVQQLEHHESKNHVSQTTGVTPGSTQQYTAKKPVTGQHMASQNVPMPEVAPVANVDPSTAPAIGATETQGVAPSTDAQQAMATEPVAAPAVAPAVPHLQAAQSVATPTDEAPAEAPAPSSTMKGDLPQVPLDAEFEEDTTEALASLEPINTLVETLEKDITELWSYKDLYPNADSLGLDNEKVHNTYANLGSLSGLSLRRALNRALRGEDVGLGVVGGSISKGGPFSEKGLEYVLRSYFYAIEDYWNKVIRPVTGSSMIVRDVSLGGISTDYYSFCIRNHLPDDKLTNIVLWELSANDMRRYDDSLKPKPQPLEQFTRNILTYRAKPALIFVNFFALFDWDPDLRTNCRNFEDEGEDDVAKYYKITSLSWRNMVCPLLKTESSPIFTRNNLFAEDHFHPSILGHAQMSYIIIDYIRTEFLKNLVKMRPFFIGDAVEKLQIPRSVYMPRPMFKETFLWKPLCYTYMLVDNRLPNNTMPLHEENESDFKYTVVRGFKIRSDKIAGMETKMKDQFIRYKLQIPRHEDGGMAPFKQLGIMSFTDDRYAEIQFDSQHPTRLEAKKRFLEGTVVKTIAENIEPGDHTLTVRSGDSGFLICALVLG